MSPKLEKKGLPTLLAGIQAQSQRFVSIKECSSPNLHTNTFNEQSMIFSAHIQDALFGVTLAFLYDATTHL